MKKQLKIGLLGFGRMGKEVAFQAGKKGHQVNATFDSKKPLSASSSSESIDVLIDFSIPAAVLDNIKLAAETKKPIVIGTTGWNNNLTEVKRIVESNQMGLIYASNFSLGMNLFLKLVQNAASLFNKLEHYDPFVHEIHHNQKIDSPGGTALTLGEILLANIQRKSEILIQKSEGKILPNQLHISSTRVGCVPGTHRVGFDSNADTIELIHTARNRTGFALGAIYAAEWIIGKQGLFTLDDVLVDLMK